MERQAGNFIELLRCLASGESPTLTKPDFATIHWIAYRQGMTGLLYPLIRQLPTEQQPEQALLNNWKQMAFTAATRSELQTKQLNALCEALSERSIPALPLKGIVLKRLYTKPEYRTMSDVDLLLPLDSRPQVEACAKDLGFALESQQTDRVDAYTDPYGLRFELHYDLTDEAPTEESRAFLASLLSRAKPFGDRLALSAEEQYVYVLSHMAKHLQSGGSGVRQVMDIWVCRHRQALDGSKVAALLAETKLEQFAAVAENLADAWFSNAATTPLADQLGEDILAGKLFGTERQRAEKRLIKSGGNRLTYWLRRLFPPFSVMRSYFPFLKKAPFLLPLFWIVRYFRGLFSGRDRLKQEYNAIRSMDIETISEKEELLANCGLYAAPNEKGEPK